MFLRCFRRDDNGTSEINEEVRKTICFQKNTAESFGTALRAG